MAINIVYQLQSAGDGEAGKFGIVAVKKMTS
jgi:hypothetical protein